MREIDSDINWIMLQEPNLKPCRLFMVWSFQKKISCWDCWIKYVIFHHRHAMRSGGALTWKGGMGMSGGQDPLFTPLPPFFRSSVAAWFSSLDPHFEQKYQILTPTREICQNFEEFSALSPKFGSNFSSLPLKMLKIFSSLDLTFAKIQFLDPPPHFGALRWTYLPKIKLNGSHPGHEGVITWKETLAPSCLVIKCRLWVKVSWT